MVIATAPLHANDGGHCTSGGRFGAHNLHPNFPSATSANLKNTTVASWFNGGVRIFHIADGPFGGVNRAVDVPYGELSAELLHAVVESFVLREGTDYGERELSLEEKVAGVMRQLRKGEAKIVFDPETESVTIAVRQNNR